MPLTFDTINRTINVAVQSRELELQRTIQGLQNPTTQDLLVMQQQLQQWTLMTNTQSAVVKELGDLLKSIIQKTG
jgi:type III secretion protein F